MNKILSLAFVTILLCVVPLHARPKYADALRPKLEKLMRDICVPGAVVYVRSPGLGNWVWTYGTQRLGAKTPITFADHIRIGSNTKTMTATIILQLVGEGRLKLDDVVSRYVPGVPNGDKITLRNLLEMRSGLYNYTFSKELNASLDNTPARVFTQRELLALALQNPPSFAPGAKYEYSNTNYLLLGIIIEKICGRPADEVFQRRIFKPLGLRNTLMPKPADASIPNPHPQGYQFGTNVSTIETAVLPRVQQVAAQAGTLKPSDVTNENPSWANTAGAVISTADDLARYVQALVGGGLLSARMQKVRIASLIPTGSKGGAAYGLGIAKMGPLYGHIGDIPGFNSFMGYDPQRKITVIAWTTLSAGPDGVAPAAALGRTIISQLYGSSAGVDDPAKHRE